MPFHIDYRPEKFSDMIGNKATISSLQRLLGKDDHPHTYLFYGPAGCGKTTAARICISELNIHPLMIHEINSANNRGIDTARTIIERIEFLPLEGVNVAYIIDEVHKTTKDWMNAMLKPLEDTPSHVYFFLCTTDKRRLIKALLSRCSEFQFNPLDYNGCIELIDRVVNKEEITISNFLRKELVKYSEGIPRNLLINLERVSGIPEQEARGILSGQLNSDSEIIDLCRALAKGYSWDRVRNIIKQLSTSDVEAIRRSVLGYSRSMLLNSDRPNGRALEIIREFYNPFYDIGMPGVVAACCNLSSRGVSSMIKPAYEDF